MKLLELTMVAVLASVTLFSQSAYADNNITQYGYQPYPTIGGTYYHHTPDTDKVWLCGHEPDCKELSNCINTKGIKEANKAIKHKNGVVEFK